MKAHELRMCGKYWSEDNWRVLWYVGRIGDEYIFEDIEGKKFKKSESEIESLEPQN